MVAIGRGCAILVYPPRPPCTRRPRAERTVWLTRSRSLRSPGRPARSQMSFTGTWSTRILSRWKYGHGHGALDTVLFLLSFFLRLYLPTSTVLHRSSRPFSQSITSHSSSLLLGYRFLLLFILPPRPCSPRLAGLQISVSSTIQFRFARPLPTPPLPRFAQIVAGSSSSRGILTLLQCVVHAHGSIGAL